MYYSIEEDDDMINLLKCCNCNMEYHFNCIFENKIHFDNNKQVEWICGLCVGFKQPNVMIPYDNDYINLGTSELEKCVHYFTEKIKFCLYLYICIYI